MMAIYHLSLKTIKRSAGRSAVAAAAYRAGALLHDTRTGITHDYSRKRGILACGIELPEGAAAPWAMNRQSLWNAAEAAERRRDSQTAQEFELALPEELGEGRNMELVRSFAGELVREYGCAADWAIHAPARGGDERNVHAHILVTVREILPDGPGGKIRLVQEQARLKREGRPLSREQLRMIRERWAELANHALAQAGLDVRIDHRSHEARGIGIIPTRHAGVHATAMGRKGIGIERAALDPQEAELNAAHILAHPEDILQLVSEGRSVFGVSDIRRAVGLAVGGAGPAAQAVLRAVMNSPELVRIPSDGGPDAPLRLTTRRTVAMETALAKCALALRGDRSHGVSGSVLEDAIAASGGRMAAAGIPDGLSAEQCEALRHVGGPAGIAVVSGAAGAGKSTMLEAARDAWERSGRRVIGAALAGKAVDGLAGSSGIESRTLSAWVHRWGTGQDRLGAGDVLVIDEAGMLGTAQLSSVLREVERCGAKAVLVGDAEQLQAIGAGSPFRALADSCGAASISEIRRQREDWQRRASVLFARHETERALRIHADRGAIAFRSGGDATAAALAAAYAAHVRDSPGESRLALAHRRADVHALNAAIRAGLQATGLLAGGGTVLECSGGERSFTSGDRIAFLRNDGRLGVRNGSFGTVEAITGTQVRVRLDGGAGTAEFDAAEFRDFDHGYAATVHKSQGATVDRSFVLAGPTMDRHLAYVAMTRHRNAVSLHADSDAFGDLDGLVRRLSRAGLQPNALDHAGFLGRRGMEEPASPSLEGTFLRFGGGDAAPSPAPPDPGPDDAGAARRAALFARELALIDGIDPDAELKAGSDALAGLSQRLEAQGRRLAPDIAAERMGDVLGRCGAAGAGSPEALAQWREACRAVADAGIDINAAVRGVRSVANVLASLAASAEWLRIAHGAGMDFTAEGENGLTPLHAAVSNPNPAVTAAVLAAGADPDAGGAKGFTPLHLAAFLGREGQALCLLDAGADPAAKDSLGRIPLDLADHPKGQPMAAGPALEGLRRPRLEGLRRIRDSGGYRGPPCPEGLESLTVCHDRIDLRRLALDGNRDAAITRDAAERSPGVFAWLRRAARITMLPLRLGSDIRAGMERWAKGRGLEFDRPQPREGWSPPELRPPPDAEIMAARRKVERHRKAAGERQEREAELRRRKQRAQEELADLPLFAFRRRRELEEAVRAAQESLGTARSDREALPAPEPELDSEVLRLHSMRTGGERRRDAAARREDAARQAVQGMEADGLLLPRRRDPDLARRWEHPPKRPLLFVVASPGHVPGRDSPVRQWHHIAVWDPSSGPEALKALQLIHPDAAMAPTPELRQVWPKDVPAMDPATADHECRNWGLDAHIDMVEGRTPEPEPAEEPEPEPEKDNGPSFGF